MTDKCNDNCQQCTDGEYLERAKQLLSSATQPDAFPDTTSQRVISLALLDIAGTLREIKAIFEREANNG